MAARKKNTGHQINLNLLYPQGEAQKLYLNFFRWLINYGRFIVIIVELVVIGAFVYRFSLDSQLHDVQKQVESSTALISSYKAQETTITRVHTKLETIQNKLNLAPDWEASLKEITKYVSEGIKFQNFSVSQTAEVWDFKVIGQASNNRSLAIFLGGLKKSKSMQNISLQSIGFDQNKILFSISGNLTMQTASRSAALQP